MKIVKMILWVLGGFILIGCVSVFLMNAGMGSIKAMGIDTVDLSRLADGLYRGSFKRGRWAFRVEVTVKDHRIEKVDLVGDPEWQIKEEMASELIGRIIRNQSPKVDAISGATVTCKAFLKAVENALNSEPVR